VVTRQKSILWGVMAALVMLYLIGFVLGWASTYASWHLLLVLVAILFLYSAFTQRGA